MAIIKEKDFLELEYTGIVKDGNIVFDTSDKKIAEDNGIYTEKMDFGPIVICVGEGQLIKGLDKKIIGSETGNEYTFELSPEEAFGKKNAKFMQLIPTARFKKDNVVPYPGMQINVDGVVAVIKTVTGGRTLVDFNHPLAGKNIIYKVKLNRVVEEPKEKLVSYLKLQLHMKKPDVDVNEGIAEIKLKNELPKELEGVLIKKLQEIIPEIKEIKFTVQK